MTAPRRAHPAKFPKYVLDYFALHLRAETRALHRPARVVDPFAGVGRIHDLPPRVATTTGVELEPEWAACRARTVAGDATALPKDWTATFDAAATSPCYGNRLADSHEAKDNCAGCGGIGTTIDAAGCGDAPMFCPNCGAACSCGVLAKTMREHNRACPRCRTRICGSCGGAGTSRRYTYRHALGRQPSAGSAATLQWGHAYRALHEAAWAELARVVVPAGLVLINAKNHIRNGAEQQVVEWHAHALRGLGYTIEQIADLPGRGIRHGENYAARVDFERVIVARTPSR